MKKMFLESKNGYFGEEDSKFGGCFIPETLYSAIKELQKAYKEIFKSKEFKKELKGYYKSFVGRPTPLIYAKNVSEMLGNEIYLKFEGLANTGAHKINNALAQALLAKKMGKTHIIAETGAGQHGLATAAVCAFLKLPCKIFMGEIDIARQRPNVFIMQQFGAEVVSVKSGSQTLKDAVNEALREWSKNPDSSFYVLGSALGPYPYPDIVRDAQSIIGKEIKKQIRKALGVLPHYVIACVGGGSNALGAFSAFLEDKEVRLIGVEAGGEDFIDGKNAMRLSPQSKARVGIAHGYKSFFLQDNNGQIAPTHSISAGLDYAGVSPQLAHLHDIGRVEFMAASDKEALAAMQFFARHEGILAALESSHALSGVINLTKKMSNKIIVVNVSGRGDKDIFITAKRLCKDEWKAFLQSEIDSMQSRPAIFMPIKERETLEDSGFKIVAEEFKNDLQDIAHEGLRFIDSASKAESNKAGVKSSASVESSDDLSLEDLEGEELIQEVNDEIEEIFEQIDSIKEQIDSKEKAENLKNVIQDTISDIESNCACGAVDSIDSALDSVDSIESVNESEKATALDSALESSLDSNVETNLNSALETSLESNLESFEPEPIIEPETATEITPEITPEPNIESKQESKHYDLLHFLDSKDKKSIEKKHLNKSHFSLLEFLDPHGKLTESKKDSKQENIESNQTLESNKAPDFIESIESTKQDSITQDSIKVDSTDSIKQDSIKQDSINSTKADSIKSKKQEPQTQNLAQELQSELATHGDLDFSFLDKDDTQDSKDSNTQNIESKSNNTDSNHTTPSDTSTDSSDLDSIDAINSNESHADVSNADSINTDSIALDSNDADSIDALVNSNESHADVSNADSIDADSSDLDSIDSHATPSNADSINTDSIALDSNDANSIDTDFIDIDSIDLDSSNSHAPSNKDSNDADSSNLDSIDALVNSSDSHTATGDVDSSDSKNDADIIADMFEDVLLKDSLDSMDEDEYEIGDYCDLEDKLHLDTLEDDLTFATTNSTLESNLDSPLDSTLDSNLDLPLDSNKTLESILDSTDNLESSLDSSLNSSDNLESTLDLENNADSIESNLNLSLDSTETLESSLESNQTLEQELDSAFESSLNLDLNSESLESSLDSTLNSNDNLENNADSIESNLDLALDLDSNETLESNLNFSDNNIDLNFETNLDSNIDSNDDLSSNATTLADFNFNFDSTQTMQQDSTAALTQDSTQNITHAITTNEPKSRIFETHKDLSKIWGKSLNS